MKKLLTVLVALMLCVCCFGMVGCGLEGKYELVGIEIDGDLYEEGDKYTFMGQTITFDQMAKDAGKLELKEDEVCKFMGVKGKWTEKDDVVTVKIEGAKIKFDVDGKQLRYEVKEMSELLGVDVVYIYEKV